MYKRPSIIVDIDGTLADCDHRLHHIRNDEPTEEDTSRKTDWEAFYRDCLLDEPIEPTVELIRQLKNYGDYAIILVTGRSCDYRDHTEQWLDKHKIAYDLLLMRLKDNHTKDVDLKRKWLHMLRNGEISLPDCHFPTLAIEDRSRCIDMWREEGLVAFQCGKGDF